MKLMMRWTISGLVVAAAAVAIIAGTGGGNTRASASSGQAPISVLSPGSAAPMATSTLDPKLVANLRRAAAMPTGVPLDIDAARQALPLGGGAQVIAGPGSDGQVCAMLSFTIGAGTLNEQTAAAPTCVPADEFNTRGVSATAGSAESMWVFGVVPDGVDSVTLTYADGSTADGKVTHNAFAFHASKATERLSFSGPAGPVTIDSRSLGN